MGLVGHNVMSVLVVVTELMNVQIDKRKRKLYRPLGTTVIFFLRGIK